MITGFNFKIENGLVNWWEDLIDGDNLLAQDHTARSESRQGSYRVDDQYGNPLINTLRQGVSNRELVLRTQSETREMTLQDGRFKDCIVDTEKIEILPGGKKLAFKYQIVKRDNTTIDTEF